VITSLKNIKSVPRYIMGAGAVRATPSLLEPHRSGGNGCGARVVFLVDHFFASGSARARLAELCIRPTDALRFVDTTHEPTTTGVDALMHDLRSSSADIPAAIVGMGGGATLDTAKAVANLYTNGGEAAQYQGWDLVQHQGVFKIGIPTISGTGAESSRTCVMTNPETGLKLGMNSDHTVYDQLVLDPDLPATVNRTQYFYTGMDSYVHCIESLGGRHRSPIADAMSREVVRLCEEVFLGEDMMTLENRQRLMTASFLGGCAIASSLVGVVHPVSAGLSVVLGIHHCLANCIVMQAMDDFYPEQARRFREMAVRQSVSIPIGVTRSASDREIDGMCAAALMHEKPLANALGERFREVLTPQRLATLYRRM
jgi:3-deoxy-alpha-D-manno-octulosonate 8-oxidase